MNVISYDELREPPSKETPVKPMFSSRSALKRGEVINQGDSSISLRGEYAERLEFRWLYLCFFSLCFVVYAWSNWSVISVDCLETGDYAANALLVEDAKEFSLLTGPYSRFKFHHPGPALFYYRALGEVLNPIFPSAYACHVFAQYLLNALFFLSAISTILFWSSRPLAVFTYFFTSLFFLLELNLPFGQISGDLTVSSLRFCVSPFPQRAWHRDGW